MDSWLLSVFACLADFETCPLSPSEGHMADEDLDPAQRRSQQLKKRLDIELKVILVALMSLSKKVHICRTVKYDIVYNGC